jgi:hypothetical protein
MRAGWNPNRRRQGAGAQAVGFRRENRMRIPEPRDGKLFYERLHDPVRLNRRLHGIDRRVLVEPPRPDSAYAVTPDELCWMLTAVREPALAGVTLFVLRQPTRKQELLRSVWGRMLFDAEIAGEAGPALILEAVSLERALRWPRSLDPESMRELERLRADGHPICATRRHYVIEPSLAAARRTQLRTVLHELGHWVDWRRSPSEAAYWQRPTREREEFAHRYADELAATLVEQGRLPAERDPAHAVRREDRLDPRWFSEPR